MIELSTRKWSVIKKTAQIVQPKVAEKQKLEAQIEMLQKKLEEANSSIAEWNGAIVRMTGYSSEQLVDRVIEPTGKRDAKGKEINITKWVPSAIVSFNEETNTYIINDAPCNAESTDDQDVSGAENEVEPSNDNE